MLKQWLTTPVCQVWSIAFGTAALYTNALARCIRPFWMNKLVQVEQSIVERQVEDSVQAPQPVEVQAAAQSQQLENTTYEQLQRESILCFRLMLTTLSKQQMLDFMSQTHKLRYGERAHLYPLCDMAERYAAGPGAADSVTEPSNHVGNPEKQRHKRGRMRNFGEAPKGTPRAKTRK